MLVKLYNVTVGGVASLVKLRVIDVLVLSAVSLQVIFHKWFPSAMLEIEKLVAVLFSTDVLVMFKTLSRFKEQLSVDDWVSVPVKLNVIFGVEKFDVLAGLFSVIAGATVSTVNVLRELLKRVTKPASEQFVYHVCWPLDKPVT